MIYFNGCLNKAKINQWRILIRYYTIYTTFLYHFKIYSRPNELFYRYKLGAPFFLKNY